MESPENVARAIFQAVTDFGLNDEQLRHAKQRIDIYGKDCVEEAHRKIRTKIIMALGLEDKGGIIKSPNMSAMQMESIIPLSMLGSLKNKNPKFEGGRLVCMRLCPDHKAVVTKVMIEGGIVKYECAWFHEGARKTAWFLAEELINGDEQTKIGFAKKD